MEAKEKSKELINKFLQVYDGRVLIAKKCALICVDEILNSHIDSVYEAYYLDVKKEIENIKYG